MSKRWTLGGSLIVIALVSILYSVLPLGTAIQFGGDEGFELMKGLLISRGYKLYAQIWSDQPPLFSLLLGWCFKLFGAGIIVARLVAAGFSLLLSLCLFHLVSCRHGLLAGLVSVFLLLASPGILELSVSVMQEVPTFSVALLSLCLLTRWRGSKHWGWLTASGAVIGVSLGIKLTAALIIPAVSVEILLNSGRPRTWKKATLDVLLWVGTSGIVFGLVSSVWGQGSFASSWKAHATVQSVPGMERPEDFPFQLGVLWNHAEVLAAVLVGICLIHRKHKSRELILPLTFLLTGLLVHAIHRPWWMSYYLHLAIPMAWIGGFAVKECLDALNRWIAEARQHSKSPISWKALLVCAAVALLLVRSWGRLENGIVALRKRERVEQNRIISAMKEMAPKTHWAYSTDPIYAFHAGLLTPPELAVVTPKRFWSGQITESQIVDFCRAAGTELVLLERSKIGSAWSPLLADYRIVTAKEGLELYALKSLREK